MKFPQLYRRNIFSTTAITTTTITSTFMMKIRVHFPLLLPTPDLQGFHNHQYFLELSGTFRSARVAFCGIAHMAIGIIFIQHASEPSIWADAR